MSGKNNSGAAKSRSLLSQDKRVRNRALAGESGKNTKGNVTRIVMFALGLTVILWLREIWPNNVIAEWATIIVSVLTVALAADSWLNNKGGG